MRALLAAFLLLVGAASAAAPPVRGDLGPGLEGLDAAVLDVLQRWKIPGAALAVVHRGRLVAARGYGYADREARRPAEPGTPFALASLSKSITAVAALRLAGEGRLDLDGSALAQLGPAPGETPAKLGDPRIRSITVRQLLDHTSGFPRDAAAGGCAEEERGAAAGKVVACMLGRRLLFTPGARSRYSNFGYVFAGEVVRVRARAAAYGEAARRLVLLPMGLGDVRLEASRPDYLPGQAIGYALGSGQRLPGGGPPARAASGGWVGSVLDMTRFLGRLDGSDGTGLLPPEMLQAMLAPPSPALVRGNGSHFGLGWDAVRSGPDGVGYAKHGGLAGTATVLAHTAPDTDWAVFLGTGAGGDRADGGPRKAVSEGVRKALGAVAAWPEVDYWSRHGGRAAPGEAP